MTHELIFLASHIGHIHIVRAGAQIFQLLAGENINGDQVDFGVAVLAGLGGAHFNNFAGAAFNDYMAVFAEGRTLHRIGGRCTSVSGLECMFMLQKDTC